VALALGLAGHRWDSDFLDGVARAVQPLGAAWLNALQMTVIPLVVTQILTAVAGPRGASTVGSIGVRAVALFVASLFAAGFAAAVLGRFVLGFYEVGPEVVASIRASVVVPPTTHQAAAGSPGDWLVGLVPANLFAAAAEGQILPLFLGTLLFGLALNRLPDAVRQPVAALVRAVSEAMLVLIRWILWGTPVAAFGLVLGVTLETGGEMIGVLGAYLLVMIAVLLGLPALMYPLAVLFGRTSIVDFARAAASPQLVGLATRSSLAALPAHIESGRRYLGYSDTTVGFTVPLCTTAFKVTTPISATARALFIAHVFGITLGVGQILAFVAAMVLLSFSILGVPRGGVPARGLPAYLAIGLPIEGYIILEAVDDLVDFAQTVNNVTGHVGTAVVLSRGDRRAVG
jgi:Na+/H+-dicarboxylate symporter